MADTKISALSDGGAVADTDKFVIARAGGNFSLLGSALKAFSGASVHRTANLTVNNTSNNGIIAFDSNSAEDYDTDGYHEAVTHPSRLTVPKAGYYRVTGGVAPTSASSLAPRIYKNGVLVAQGGANTSSDGAIVARTLLLAANDFVELGNFTNSSTVTLDGTGATYTFFQIEFLGE